MLPLNGWSILRVARLGDDQVERLGAGVLDVGAGGVEVGVAGDHVARLDDRPAQQALAGPPLVGGDDVRVAEDVLHRGLEAEEAARAGVGLVALHDPGPLVRAHRPGPGVGEEVDEDVLGLEPEGVVAAPARISSRAPRAWSCGSARRP